MGENWDEYCFYFNLVQSGAIKTLIEALKEVLTEVNINIDETGLKILTVDSGRVAIIHLKLVAESFINFVCKEEIKIGVCVSSLHKLLKPCGNTDTICMYVKKNDKSSLHIEYQNKEGNRKICVRLKLLELDEDVIQVPNIEFDYVINMPSTDFQKLCRDVSSISDTLIFESLNDVFKISAEGDIGDISIEIGESSSNLKFAQKSDIHVKEKFDLNYLTSFIKSTSLCSQLQIFLKEKYPLVLLYHVANLGSLRYVLSPKIGSDY